MPNLNPNPIFYDGPITDGSKVLLNSTFEQQLVGNVTPVQATNPTAAANLMTATLQPGTLAGIGEGLEIFGAGIINLTTSTSTLTIAVILGGVTVATFTTGAFAISLNLPWNFTVVLTAASFAPAAGTPGGSFTVECHGTLQGALTTAAGSITAYNDTNTAASSSINNSVPTLLQVQATIGTGNAASFVTQRQLLVEVLN
jgi:hypothetical protein